MNYAVSFIVPNTLVAEAIRKTLKRLDYDYAVFEASRADALKLVRQIPSEELRLIVSQSITYQYLQTHLNIPIMDMPFSGIEAAFAVKQASVYSDKIVHMGTIPNYHFIKQGLKLLGIDENLVIHYSLDPERSLEEQTQIALDEGYEVVIGGFATVNYAKSKGKHGIEFGVDDQVITTTVINAHNLAMKLIDEENKAELNNAILQASSDGIIAIDKARRIFRINQAAKEITNSFEVDSSGKQLEQFLSDNKLVDISDSYTLKSLNQEQTPVVLTELPVMVRGVQQGSVVSIKKVSEIQDLEYRIRQDLVVKGFVAKNSFNHIIAKSEILNEVKKRAAIYAKYDSTLLLTGETGVGKELFAQSIHNASKRKLQPFVAINCAALPENLMESELFGYVKGAFTGANKEGKMGLFEIANNGTIFLDEISELPISMQSKLLRVIQNGEVIRIGGDKIIHVDTRIICASNKNLLQLIKEKQFKDDLYYRISALEIRIPPLRERKEDIEPLAYSILDRFNAKYSKKVTHINDDVIEYLMQLDLPGNVRELRNIIERLMILSEGSFINMETLRISDVYGEREASQRMSVNVPTYESAKCNNVQTSLKDTEKAAILAMLEKCNGNKTTAAHALGINPSTLWRKIKSFEGDKPDLGISK